MTRDVTINKVVAVRMSAAELALAFCQLDDDGQAQFFVEVARTFAAWPEPAAAALQVSAIARHMRTCECSSPDAIDWVRDLAASLEESP